MFLLRLASTISSLALVTGASLAAAAPTSDPEAPPAATSPAVPYELIVPERWSRQSTATQTVLTSPEGTISLTFDVINGSDFDAAVAAAWTAAGEVVAAPERATPAPARPGFSKARLFNYTPEGETIRQALTEARDGRIYIVLIKGERAALDRRGAQVNIAVTGFKPSDLGSESLAEAPTVRLGEAEAAALAAYIGDIMPQFDIPGAVVGIVQGGRILMLQGFGVRDRGSDAPITPDTRMMIGSIGKTMTTMLMADLVEEGLLRWEQPVQDILPQFRVSDPKLSQTITVENLVCACSGVPRRDLEFLFNADQLDAEKVIGSLADFSFFTGFGEAFQYSNQLVATGGWVAASAEGAAWGQLDEGYERLIRRRLFAPLGMDRTTLQPIEVDRDGDYGIPHPTHGSGVRRPMQLATENVLQPVAPAGAHWSTGRDMVRYLQTLLASGMAPDGERLIEKASLAKLWTPQVPVSATMSYGLGWFVDDWRGLTLVHHGGNTIGFTSDLAFLPAARTGIVVLTNAGRANDFTGAVRARLLETLFDLPHDHDARARLARAERVKQAEAMAAAAPVPVEAARAVVGNYASPMLGDVELRLEAGRLILDAGEGHGEVRIDPARPDTWIIWDGPLMGFPLKPATNASRTSALVVGEGAARYEMVRK